MDDLGARVMRLQRAAWAVRAAAPGPCSLPFALVLMTHEVHQPDIVSSAERLPRGRPALIVFRHYRTPMPERRRLAAQAHRAARSRGHVLVVAGGGAGDGGHNGPGRLRSVSVHDLAEGARKRALRPHLCLVSPVFATRSHPGEPPLGVARAAALAARLPYPSFALGGIDATRARALIGTPFQGIAVLGAWSDAEVRRAQAEGA